MTLGRNVIDALMNTQMIQAAAGSGGGGQPMQQGPQQLPNGLSAFQQRAGSVAKGLLGGLGNFIQDISVAAPYAIAAGRTSQPRYMVAAGEAVRKRRAREAMTQQLQGIDPTQGIDQIRQAAQVMLQYGDIEAAQRLWEMAESGQMYDLRRDKLAWDQEQDMWQRGMEEDLFALKERELDLEEQEMQASLRADPTIDFDLVKDVTQTYNSDTSGAGGARFKYVAEKYGSLKQSAQKALRDRNPSAYMAVVNGFIKMIDEGVVRTEEFRTAESLQSYAMQLKGMIQRGEEGFNEEVVKNIDDLAEALMTEAAELQTPIYENMLGTLQDYNPNLQERHLFAVRDPRDWLPGGPMREKYAVGLDDVDGEVDW